MSLLAQTKPVQGRSTDSTTSENRNGKKVDNPPNSNEGRVIVQSSLTDVITYANLSGFSGTGWTHGAGSQHTGGSVDVLTISNDLVDKATYEISLDIASYTNGAIRIYLNGAWSERFIGNASFKDTLRVRTDSNIKIVPTSEFDGSISNFAIKELVNGSLVVEKQIETTSIWVKTGQLDVDEASHIAFGHNALRNSTEDIYNIPSSNIGIGHFAGNIGNGTVVGYRAGQNNEEIGVITAFGKWALQANTIGHASAFGNAALRSNTTSNSSAFGDEALALSTTGNNDAFGYYAGHSYIGSESVFFGYQAGRLSASGIKTLGGYNAGYSAFTSNLTGYGHNAGRGWESGSGIAIGRDAGYNVFSNIPVNDTRGMLIGDFSGRTVLSSIVLDNYLALGYGAAVDKSNQFVFGRNGILENKFHGSIKWAPAYLNADGSQSELTSMWVAPDGNLYYKDEMSLVKQLNGAALWDDSGVELTSTIDKDIKAKQGFVFVAQGAGMNTAFDGAIMLGGGSDAKPGTELGGYVEVPGSGDLYLLENTIISGYTKTNSLVLPPANVVAASSTLVNWMPANWLTETVHFINATAALNLESAEALPDGTIRTIVNTGIETITVSHSTTSLNSFKVLPGYTSFVLVGGDSITIMYSNSTVDGAGWVKI